MCVLKAIHSKPFRINRNNIAQAVNMEFAEAWEALQGLRQKNLVCPCDDSPSTSFITTVDGGTIVQADESLGKRTPEE